MASQSFLANLARTTIKYFDYEPYFSPVPRASKRIVSCSSAPSYDGSGNPLPSVDTFLDRGVSERGSKITVESDWITRTLFEKFDAWYKEKPATHKILRRYYTNDSYKEYRVIIEDFDGSPSGGAIDGIEIYSFTMSLLVIQVL